MYFCVCFIEMFLLFSFQTMGNHGGISNTTAPAIILKVLFCVDPSYDKLFIQVLFFYEIGGDKSRTLQQHKSISSTAVTRYRQWFIYTSRFV